MPYGLPSAGTYDPLLAAQELARVSRARGRGGDKENGSTPRQKFWKGVPRTPKAKKRAHSPKSSATANAAAAKAAEEAHFKRPPASPARAPQAPSAGSPFKAPSPASPPSPPSAASGHYSRRSVLQYNSAISRNEGLAPYSATALPGGRVYAADANGDKLLLFERVAVTASGPAFNVRPVFGLGHPSSVCCAVPADVRSGSYDDESTCMLYVTDRSRGAPRILGVPMTLDGREVGSRRLSFGPDQRLPDPQELAVSADGRALFVSDTTMHAVIELDARTLGFVQAIGGAGVLDTPYGLATCGGELYVAEQGAHRISVFARAAGGLEWERTRQIGARGVEPGQLRRPRGLCILEALDADADADAGSTTSVGGAARDETRGGAEGGVEGGASADEAGEDAAGAQGRGRARGTAMLIVAEAKRMQVFTLGGEPVQLLDPPHRNGTLWGVGASCDGCEVFVTDGAQLHVYISAEAIERAVRRRARFEAQAAEARRMAAELEAELGARAAEARSAAERAAAARVVEEREATVREEAMRAEEVLRFAAERAAAREQAEVDAAERDAQRREAAKRAAAEKAAKTVKEVGRQAAALAAAKKAAAQAQKATEELAERIAQQEADARMSAAAAQRKGRKVPASSRKEAGGSTPFSARGTSRAKAEASVRARAEAAARAKVEESKARMEAAREAAREAEAAKAAAARARREAEEEAVREAEAAKAAKAREAREAREAASRAGREAAERREAAEGAAKAEAERRREAARALRKAQQREQEEENRRHAWRERKAAETREREEGAEEGDSGGVRAAATGAAPHGYAEEAADEAEAAAPAAAAAHGGGGGREDEGRSDGEEDGRSEADGEEVEDEDDEFDDDDVQGGGGAEAGHRAGGATSWGGWSWPWGERQPSVEEVAAAEAAAEREAMAVEAERDRVARATESKAAMTEAQAMRAAAEAAARTQLLGAGDEPEDAAADLRESRDAKVAERDRAVKQVLDRGSKTLKRAVGLRPLSTEAQVRKESLKLMRLLHPDFGINQPLKGTKQGARIVAAFKKLNDLRDKESKG